LLRILAGLEKPTTGKIHIDREDHKRPLTSMVFQEDSIFPWMTVQQNVAYGLNNRGVARKQRNEIVHFWIEKVGLSRFKDAYPHQLSGGMKQRVSIARAFANDPEVLLMDEPFSALDEQNKTILQQELLRIWEETRKAVVFITHSIDEAIILGDRILVMTTAPGQIMHDFTVPLPRPRNVLEVRANPVYGELQQQIWRRLQGEVEKARDLEGSKK
jgi:NitT/TauT family transport system ATP-binding protein